MRGRVTAPCLLAAGLGLAAPAWGQWQYGAPLAVTPPVAGAFPHLDASGRKAIAVSSGRVALVWEDSRSGRPTCYLAIKELIDSVFHAYAFGRGECFEPAIAALPEGRFVLIWEDEQGVAVARADRGGITPPLALAPSGGQGSLAWHPLHGLHAAWSGPDGRWRRVWRSRLALAPDGMAQAAAPQPADPSPLKDDQNYPVLSATATTVSLAWEDRKLGHTVIYGSTTRDGRAWSAPLRISQNPTGRVNDELGRGTGAMRPTLAAHGGDRLAMIWLDKRDFLSGYDVYAALSSDGGLSFGVNRLAQDSFGEAIAQWHAAAAGDAEGNLVVTWDDERDGSPDIWITRLQADGGFADNRSPAGGPGSQSDPVIALDEAGNLHLAWIERDAAGVGQIRYLQGKRLP